MVCGVCVCVCVWCVWEYLTPYPRLTQTQPANPETTDVYHKASKGVIVQVSGFQEVILASLSLSGGHLVNTVSHHTLDLFMFFLVPGNRSQSREEKRRRWRRKSGHLLTCME